MKPAFTIVHRLPNRIRIKLIVPLQNKDELIHYLLEKIKVSNVLYNKVSKSLVINFDTRLLTFEDVLMGTIIAISIDSNFLPVRVFEKSPYDSRISHLAVEAGIAIGVAGVYSIFSPMNLIRRNLNLIAAGLTAGAVIEHGISEVKNKGVFDPEVVSIFYLINSLLKHNYLQASAITWTTTFARHIFNITKDGKEYQTLRDRDNEGNINYHVVITQDKNVTNLEYQLSHIFNRKNTLNRVEEFGTCNNNGCVINKGGL